MRESHTIQSSKQCVSCAKNHNNTSNASASITKYRQTEAYRTYHRNYTRSNQRRFRYGLTNEKFDKLLIEQDGCCAICENLFIKTPHVDHNHENNHVRGLLCKSCNLMLGYAKDNPKILETAIIYLESR